jgi:hypothetical protein
MLRAAIDEVALAARAERAGHTDPGELAKRLAGLWAMIAELDPALAARLRGYGPEAGRDMPLCRRPGRASSLPLVLVRDHADRNRAVGVRGLVPPGGYRGPTAKSAGGRRAR